MLNGAPLKVLVVGPRHTGKTSLVRCYVEDDFVVQKHSTKATVGVDFATKSITRPSGNFSLQLWDIVGQEAVMEFTRVFYSGAVGAIVVCDVSQPGSFEAATRWKQNLDANVFIDERGGVKVPCVLVITKSDLGALHKSDEEMNAFCRMHGFRSWYLTSAKARINIDSTFGEVADLAIGALANPMRNVTVPRNTVDQQGKKRPSCAC